MHRDGQNFRQRCGGAVEDPTGPSRALILPSTTLSEKIVARRGVRIETTLPASLPTGSKFLGALHSNTLIHLNARQRNARGKDINLIKEVLGYADITSTQRYLHVGVDQGRGALNETFRFNISAALE